MVGDIWFMVQDVVIFSHSLSDSLCMICEFMGVVVVC